MALRLSVSSLTPENRPDTGGGSSRPAPALSLAAQLSVEARVALDAHDLDSYRALFARATGDDDGSLVFHARTRLIEEGLAAAQRTDSSGRAIQIFIAVASAAIELLEQEPREPILLTAELHRVGQRARPIRGDAADAGCHAALLRDLLLRETCYSE